MRIHIPLLGVVKGGGLRVIVQIANGLARKGHEITISATACNSIPFLLDDRIEVIYINNAIPVGQLQRLISALMLLKNTCKNNNEVIVSNYYTSSFIGYIASAFTSARHVYFVQGYEPGFFSLNTPSSRFKRALAIMSYNLPSRIITISNWIRVKINTHTKKEIAIINDGIDTVLFTPKKYYEEQIKSHIIMVIACLEKRKGLSEFISAVELLWEQRKDISIKFVTSDPTLVIESKVPHEISMPATDEDLVNCYQNSSVFVSTSHLEGFGLPPLEAMACGTAVVTTDSGGINEYAINGENCLIVPVGNVEAIYLAINMLIENGELRSKLIEGGIQTSSKFTWEVMVDKFEMELLKVCEKTI